MFDFDNLDKAKPEDIYAAMIERILQMTANDKFFTVPDINKLYKYASYLPEGYEPPAHLPPSKEKEASVVSEPPLAIKPTTPQSTATDNSLPKTNRLGITLTPHGYVAFPASDPYAISSDFARSVSGLGGDSGVLDIARRYLGEKETGNNHFEMNGKDIACGSAWCSAFVSAVLMQAGVYGEMERGSKNLAAKYNDHESFASASSIARDPSVRNQALEVGNTIFFNRFAKGQEKADRKGHVGFISDIYVDKNGREVIAVISGNMGDMVREDTFYVDDLLAGKKIKGLTFYGVGDNDKFKARYNHLDVESQFAYSKGDGGHSRG